MTNAEKYKEVFGFEHPDCPTWHCPSCPVFKECSEHHFSEIAHKWWNSEYEEGGADMRSENKFQDLVVFDDQPKRQLEDPDCHNEL